MSTTAVETARQVLGPIGPVLPVSFTSMPTFDEQRAGVRALENAGFRAAWTNEVIGGKDALVQVAILLAATERMAFGTGISNIWAREPQTMHAAAAQLSQAYPGRFVLGLGVGYPEQAAGTGREFGKPLATMRDYLDRMSAPTSPPAPDAEYPRIVAANGPKMLALAAEVADGALPAMLPPEFTAQARAALGPDKLLVTGLSIIPDADRERARAAARAAITAQLGRPAFAELLTGFGYPAEATDEVVDALVGYGDAETIADRVRAHLAAGSDHVTLLLPIGTDFRTGIDQFAGLASALTGLR